MMASVIEDVRRTVEKYGMLQSGDKVVVGVSGGPDSICLLHVLKGLAEVYGITLYAAHLNHMFRGKAAEEDAVYVEQICRDWGIQAFIETYDVPAYAKRAGLSPEEAGREMRYKLFYQVSEAVGSSKIAVAQNQNDHVETVLMRFMRGSGIEGLKGIEPVRDNIIRPLIGISRDRIEAYCREAGLEPRTDLTNLEPVFVRNRIRLELLPYLAKHFNPNIMMALTRFSDLVKEENDYLESQAGYIFAQIAESGPDRIIYKQADLLKQHTALQRRLIRIGIEKLSKGLQSFEFKHVEGVLALLEQSTGAALMLPKGLKAYISYGRLILAKDVEMADKKCYYKLKYDCSNEMAAGNALLVVERRNRSEVDGISKDKHTILIDEAKIHHGLVLRCRQQGDVFSPFGMMGSKKLKEYFIDEKVPREERDAVPLIADGSEVVWIVGRRFSEKYKITDKTQKIIIIKYVGRTYNGEGYTEDHDQ